MARQRGPKVPSWWRQRKIQNLLTFFLIQSTKLAASSEGLNSSITQPPGEVWLAEIGQSSGLRGKTQSIEINHFIWIQSWWSKFPLVWNRCKYEKKQKARFPCSQKNKINRIFPCSQHILLGCSSLKFRTKLSGGLASTSFPQQQYRVRSPQWTCNFFFRRRALMSYIRRKRKPLLILLTHILHFQKK